MAKKIIITVARQYGSGGREIGERVAELLGISQSYISRLEKRILMKLKEEIKEKI